MMTVEETKQKMHELLNSIMAHHEDGIETIEVYDSSNTSVNVIYLWHNRVHLQLALIPGMRITKEYKRRHEEGQVFIVRSLEESLSTARRELGIE